jgi:Tol biopolymer transport system component
MGEVYRARDERLKRDVAIKVLPASFAQDADRLRRFEQEAQAAGGLNHPNITAVFDLGTHDGAPYIVQELLEGETLRAALAGGRLSPRRAVDCARQIASGLAAAHERGIVHRDLKPENVFVTRDGRVKILDFGLAKLRPDEASPATNIPTATKGTEPGVVLGTLGYMSPEQVRGKPADARSDIFSFGAILYEMLSGNRPFRGDSAADTMSAILKEDPPDLSQTNQNVPPGLERIVRHCLEKNAGQRFHSAHDVAFALDAVSGISAPGTATIVEKRRVGSRALRIAAGLAIVAAIAATAYFLGNRSRGAEPPIFRQITFRQGSISGARFAPDGHTIVYAASWGGPIGLYQARPGISESTSIDVPGAERVLSVAKSGEMLVHRLTAGSSELSRVAMTGGALRPVAEGAIDADWAPDGRSIALSRWVGGEAQLEYPIGTVLYKTSGWITYLRVSPDGERVAFIDNPLVEDDRGSLAVVDRAGKKTTLTKEWASANGVGWSPSGKQIFFASAEHGTNLVIRSISPDGRGERRILSGPGRLLLRDVAADGRLLIEERTSRHVVMCRPAGQPRERDLSWLGSTSVIEMSRDGSQILFDEQGEGSGEAPGVFIRRTDGSPAVRLGDGIAMAFTPDEKGVVALVPGPQQKLVVLPIGTGQPRVLPDFGLRLRGGGLLPGDQLLLVGARPGEALGTFVAKLPGGPLRPVGPARISGPPMVSPDGKFLFAVEDDGRAQIYPLDGGPPRPIPGNQPGEWGAGWSADGRYLFVNDNQPENRVWRVDLELNRREPWLAAPPDRPAGSGSWYAVVAGDGKSYVYSYSQTISELFVVEGIK